MKKNTKRTRLQSLDAGQLAQVSGGWRFIDGCIPPFPTPLPDPLPYPYPDPYPIPTW